MRQARFGSPLDTREQAFCISVIQLYRRSTTPPRSFTGLRFEYKFSEAVELLMALGATHIEVEHVTGWSDDFSARLNVGLGPAASGGAEAKTSRRSGMQLLFVANLSGTAAPEHLVWYHHEPTWQRVADGRLKYGLNDFSLTVSYEDDFGVNAQLKVAAQDVGLDLGGSFEDHQSTVWRIVGEFDGTAAIAKRAD